MDLERIRANFEILDDWTDRYAFIIDLGKHLPLLAESKRTEDNLVRGCQSRVWLAASVDQAKDTMHFSADSEAHIVKGLVALVLIIFNGKSPKHVLNIDEAQLFEELGLTQHLSPTRSNGLASMVRRIKELAHNAGN